MGKHGQYRALVAAGLLLAGLMAGPAAGQSAGQSAGPSAGGDGWPRVAGEFHDRGVTRIAGDFDGDGRVEVAEVSAGETVRLVIREGARVEAEAPAIAWLPGVGEGPWISVNPQGSLVVEVGHFGIGRSKWEMRVTVAHRDGAWRVAGLDLGGFDALTPGSDMVCEVNLLTGRGTVAAGGAVRKVAGPRPAPPVADWTEDDPLALCGPLP
jgi:hypothetical protein